MDDLKVEVTEVQPCVKRLSIEIPEKTVAGESEKAFREVKKSASVQGFRKGHVPNAILKKIYGKSVLYDVGRQLINDGVSAVITKHDLSVLGSPTIEDATVEEGKPISFTALVETLPSVELPDISGWSLTRERLKIDDAMIDSQAGHLRESKAEMVPVEGRPVAVGDYVFIDYTGTVDGKEVESLKGANQQTLVKDDEEHVLAGFHSKLIGLEKGVASEFSITLSKQYPDPALAGKEASFRVMVNVIKEKTLPELTDEFVNAETAHKSVKEFREAIKEALEKRAVDAADLKLKKDVMERLKEETAFDLPPKLIEEYTRECAAEVTHRAKMSGADIMAQPDFDKNKFDAKCRVVGESRAREYVIIESLAKKENIKSDEKELKKRLEEYGAYMKENHPQADEGELRRAFGTISFEVFINSVYRFLLSKVKITDRYIDSRDDEQNKKNVRESK
ncbi:MAG: trigger factor [bacterium]|nr:MAG: trigger factor [bacterium]